MNNIKILGLLSVLMLTTGIAFSEVPNNFNELPEDIKIEILYQHINDFLNPTVTQEEYNQERERISKLPDKDMYEVYVNKDALVNQLKKPGSLKYISYNDFQNKIAELRKTSPAIMKIIDSDKFKSKIKSLIQEKFGAFKAREEARKEQEARQKEYEDYMQGK